MSDWIAIITHLIDLIRKADPTLVLAIILTSYLLGWRGMQDNMRRERFLDKKRKRKKNKWTGRK